MSRSYRKNPILGNSGSSSEKKDKHIANHKFRRKSKMAIKSKSIDNMPHVLNEVHNEAIMSKDGKQYLDKDKSLFKSKKWKRK